MKQSIIYARPNGGHYHLNKDCTMLKGGDYERLGYKEISREDIKEFKLNPCVCALEGKWDDLH